MDCSLPGFSARGISQASLLEWVVISFSRGSSQHRDWIQDSCFSRWILYQLSHKQSPSLRKSENEVVQSCLTLCNPMDCSLQGSSIHGIFQARVLEWVVISFSRGSSRPRDWTQVSCICRWILYHWDTREAPKINYMSIFKEDFKKITMLT